MFAPVLMHFGKNGQNLPRVAKRLQVEPEAPETHLLKCSDNSWGQAPFQGVYPIT